VLFSKAFKTANNLLALIRVHSRLERTNVKPATSKHGELKMEMPKPTDAHRKLEMLVGRWLGEERLFPSPWDPKGGTAIGRIDNRLALDGFIVVQDYEQERDGKINFRGHGVFSWDATQKCYVIHWFDSMGMPPNIFRGNFENNTLTMTSEDQQGHSRVVFAFTENNKYSFSMEMSQDGKQWQTLMEGNYTREG
jgi:hypothetical protein